MANSDWSTLPLILSAFNYFRQISPSFDLHPNISDRFPSQFIFVGDKINTSQSTGRVELCQIFHPNNWCTDICKTPIPTFKPLAILTFSALVLRPSVDFLLLPSSDHKTLPPITNYWKIWPWPSLSHPAHSTNSNESQPMQWWINSECRFGPSLHNLKTRQKQWLLPNTVTRGDFCLV